MQTIFMDESGTLSFGDSGTDYFVLALVAPTSMRQLSRAVKNFNAHLIRKGWNPDVEIKASNVRHAGKSDQTLPKYQYREDYTVPLRTILEKIASLDLYIEYVVVKLDTVDEHLRSMSNSILYNYLSWQLFKGPLTYFPAVTLVVDRRNREYHHVLKFDGYIEGQAATKRAEKKKSSLNLVIHHYHSDSESEASADAKPYTASAVRGLEAADFVCWAIKSKYENGDDTWMKILEDKIKWVQHLYFEPGEKSGS